MTMVFSVAVALVLCLVSNEAWSRSPTPGEAFRTAVGFGAQRIAQRPAVGRADYEKVHLALKLRELQAILREPGRDVFQMNPTDIPGAKFVSAAPKGTRVHMRSGGNWEVGIVDNALRRMYCWCCSEAFLLVRIDQDSRITDYMLFTHEPDR